jgi:hypothetical protein
VVEITELRVVGYTREQATVAALSCIAGARHDSAVRRLDPRRVSVFGPILGPTTLRVAEFAGDFSTLRSS